MTVFLILYRKMHANVFSVSILPYNPGFRSIFCVFCQRWKFREFVSSFSASKGPPLILQMCTDAILQRSTFVQCRSAFKYFETMGCQDFVFGLENSHCHPFSKIDSSLTSLSHHIKAPQPLHLFKDV
jgi:hypothetical protein